MDQRHIAHYEIAEEIARGGMGIVYRARDTKLGRDVALKVLPLELTRDEDRKRRFVLEARTTAALEHPHIAVVHDFGEAGGQSYLVMELIRGEPLWSFIDRERLSPLRALELSIEIAEGLRCAHGRDILHRDLKPANIMVSEDGHAKIIDFGLAKLLEPSRGDGNEDDTAIRGETEPGVVVGTHFYMSPEQVRGHSLDSRSDLFSFGVCMYEMLSGSRPFSGRTGADLTSAILRDPVPPLSELHLDIPPGALSELQRILDKCLAKDPDDRYQSAKDLIVDLKRTRRLIEPGVVSDSSVPSPSPRPLPRIWLLAGLVGVVLVAGLFGRSFLMRESGPEADRTDLVLPSVAVLGFKNLSGRPETEWLSTALSEMLGTELATASGLRVLSGEDVARMKAELALVDADSFAKDTLTRIRSNLGTDFVVLGSYTALFADGGSRIRLDLRLQDASAGETLASMAESGTEEELFELVERAGVALRQQLGVESHRVATDVSAARAISSSNPRAMRFYADGLSKLRRHDAVGARVLLEQAVEHDPDYALAHAALSRTWTELGYDRNAAESAKRAFDLAAGLPREQFLVIEALHHETSREWNEAVETYNLLWTFVPDSVEYGIRLAGAQRQAGLVQAALETIRGLKELPPPLGEDPRIDLEEAEAAHTMSDYGRAVEATRRAIEKARAQEAWTLVADGLLVQGPSLISLGRSEEAQEALAESRRLFLQTGDRGKAASALNIGAIVLKERGEIAAAEALYREALSIHRDTGNLQWVSRTMNHISLGVLERGDLGASQSLLEQALEIDREIRDPHQEALHLANLVWILFEEASLPRARAENEKVCVLYETLQTPGGQAECYFLRGRLALAEGSLEEAEREFERTLLMWEDMEDRSNIAFAHHALGEARWARGDLEAAASSFAEALRIRQELQQSSWIVRTHISQSLLSTDRGEPGEAETIARKALEAFDGVDSDDELMAAVALAEALLARGDVDGATRSLGAVEKRAGSSQRPMVRLLVQKTAARILGAGGDVGSARAKLGQIRSEAETIGLVLVGLDARLSIAALDPKGNQNLVELAADAERLGFGVVASKARALSRER
ncbi:MAG TPA: protein kinase [Vicinamibacteria bacterium]|nr:protein kinase [Vicinamibacteria bacterium]